MEMLEIWMYVSRSCLAHASAPEAIEKIVREAQAYNVTSDVSGALLYTGSRFAQLIEGSSEAISRLRGSISADERHDDLVLLSPAAWTEPRFAGWALAYSGPSEYIAAAVERAAANGREQSHAEELVRLMAALRA